MLTSPRTRAHCGASAIEHSHEAHFVGRLEAELLVQRPALEAGVQDEPPHTLLACPPDHVLHQGARRALPAPGGLGVHVEHDRLGALPDRAGARDGPGQERPRSEEHTSELQSPCNLVCRLLLEKKKTNNCTATPFTLLTSVASTYTN